MFFWKKSRAQKGTNPHKSRTFVVLEEFFQNRHRAKRKRWAHSAFQYVVCLCIRSTMALSGGRSSAPPRPSASRASQHLPGNPASLAADRRKAADGPAPSGGHPAHSSRPAESPARSRCRLRKLLCRFKLLQKSCHAGLGTSCEKNSPVDLEPKNHAL